MWDVQGFLAAENTILLGGAAAWPLAARAQQPGMPVIDAVLRVPSAEVHCGHTMRLSQSLNVHKRREGVVIRLEGDSLPGRRASPSLWRALQEC